MEVECKIFEQTIKPDYQIMRKCSDKDDDSDYPLFVIEVKRTEKANNKSA